MDQIKQIPRLKLIILVIGAFVGIGVLIGVFVNTGGSLEDSTQTKQTSQVPAGSTRISVLPQTVTMTPQPERDTPTILPVPTFILPPQTEWKTYSGNTFTIQYPPNWVTSVNPIEDGGEVLTLQPEVLPPSFVFVVTVSVQKQLLINDDPASVDDVYFKAMGYSRSQEEFNGITYTKLIRKALAADVNGKSIRTPVYETFFNTDANGYSYSIGYKYSSQNVNAQYEPIMRKILLSFQMKR